MKVIKPFKTTAELMLKGIDPNTVADYSSISEIVTKGQIQAEEKLLIKVLTQYLKRKPTDDDFRNCTKIERKGVINAYVLAHLSVKLGLVVREFKCNSKDLDIKTGYPVFKFNCLFNPDILEVPVADPVAIKTP